MTLKEQIQAIFDNFEAKVSSPYGASGFEHQAVDVIRQLEAKVVELENPRRKIDRRVSHCIKGHEYTEENSRFYMDKGVRRRQCRICHRNNNKNYYKKQALTKDKPNEQ